MERDVQFYGLACACKTILLLGLLLAGCAALTSAHTPTSKITCRADLPVNKRQALAAKLAAITGWPALHFDEAGGLQTGQQQAENGSATARALLTRALAGRAMLVFEDASNRPDVVFCRVVAGRWLAEAKERPTVYVVLIDFEDFNHVMGDQAALDSFNIGWGVLHEIAHVVYDAADPQRGGELGACEALINVMRRECGLAERAAYYYTYLPGTQSADFKTRFVRLAFVRQEPAAKRKKRFWLFWDATLTGGLDDSTLIATIR